MFHCYGSFLPPRGCPGIFPVPPPEIEVSVCDCCVEPMQFVLQQLIGQTVTITTIADTPTPEGSGLPPFFLTVQLLSVNNFLATVNKPAPDPGTYVISIYDIVGVTFANGILVTLPQPTQQPASGICACKELPLRAVFTSLSLSGTPVTIRTTPGISSPPGTIVTAVGEGTILVSFPENPPEFGQAVGSICTVTYVYTG